MPNIEAVRAVIDCGGFGPGLGRILPNRLLDLTMRGAVSDVLTPTGAVIPANATVADAEQKIDALGCADLYAVAEDGQLVGILPDYALLKRRLSGDLRAQCVADLMSPVAAMLTCATSLADVAVLMRSGCHRRIPVVANGRLVGEVTRRNLLRFLRAESGRESDSLQSAVTSEGQKAGAAAGPPKFLRSLNAAARDVRDVAGDSATETIAIGL